MKSKAEKGFTMLETLVYIFITVIILNCGMFLSITMYKAYLNNCEISKEYNDIQNFYLELQDIISQRNVKKVVCTENKIRFYKNTYGKDKIKSIEYRESDNSIVVKTIEDGMLKATNKMIGNIKKAEFVNKNKLIYLILYDKDGKEFISCL